MMSSKKLQQIFGPRAPADEIAAHRLRYMWPAICMGGGRHIDYHLHFLTLLEFGIAGPPIP
jgi:hypothetical protein